MQILHFKIRTMQISWVLKYLKSVILNFIYILFSTMQELTVFMEVLNMCVTMYLYVWAQRGKK